MTSTPAAPRFFLTLSFYCTCAILSGCSDEQTSSFTANPDGTFSLNEKDQAAYVADGYSIPTFHMAQLQWQAPTQRSGGTPQQASEIKSYFVYFFKDSAADEAPNEPVKINVGNRTRVGMPLEEPGKYYFAVSTVDNEKRESELTEFIAVNVK